jgi:NADH:ubiquinone reductase (H+-translocating)
MDARRSEATDDGRSHRVVVVGGGFGGLRAVRALRDAPVEVTLVDRRNHHLFQPLLYQVAAGVLSPDEIAPPLRGILRDQRNARVVMGEVGGFDLGAREVLLDRVAGGGEGSIPYDTLIVAAGARHSYFGHDEWEASAPGLKSVEDALEIRRRVLTAFEAAEAEPDPGRRAEWLTFVVVGGGPTGVEVAGQIAEIAHTTLRRDFRSIDPTTAAVLLVEAGGGVLRSFHPTLSERASTALAGLGVSVHPGCLVTDVDRESISIVDADGTRRLGARTVIWAAGVSASPLAAALAEAADAPLDRSGRVGVRPDMTLPDHPEVFAIGDMAAPLGEDGEMRPLPGVAPVAMQQGGYVGRVIARRLAGEEAPAPFSYRDKGSMATIGRRRAVVEIGPLRLSGGPAWAVWLAIHLGYLVGFQNRLLVTTRWASNFLLRSRDARQIGEDRPAGAAHEALIAALAADPRDGA